MKVSVIIPTYNKASRLKYMLQGLSNQDLEKDDFEVIIINDGSMDNTEEVVNGFRKEINIKYIYEENRGQATARNKGIAVAENEVILFLDDDILVGKDLVRRHAEEHEKNRGSVVLGKINLIPASNYETVVEVIEQYGYKNALYNLSEYVCEDWYLDMVEAIYRKGMLGIAWICFTGGNSSIEKKDLLKLGGFDTEFYRWGPEDIELGYRCKNAGLSFRYCQELLGYHIDKYKDRAQMMSDTARNVKYLKDKYPDDKSVANYIDYTCGGFSLEEFYCRETNKEFNADEYKDLVKFKPFDYINLKSRR